jgi:hypothetical protein
MGRPRHKIGSRLQMVEVLGTIATRFRIGEIKSELSRHQR